jgi:hypothetical protein
MQEIAEEVAAKWVITHVLDDGATVGVGARLAQLFLCRVRVAFEQKRLDAGIPVAIDDGLMRKN